MTPFTLSQNTINAINLALADNVAPGTFDPNYVAAYQAIYNDLVAANANGNTIPANVLAWFQQAPLVNEEASSPSAQGTFIWDYMTAAAFTEGGVQLTQTNIQNASNAIARAVFNTLSNSQFAFNSNANGNFSIENIIKVDAGAGLQVIKDVYPTAHLDNAIWGGTLFARTELQDATYFQDNNIQLGLGTKDSAAILAGFFAGGAGVLAAGLQPQWDALINAHFIDLKAVAAAALPTTQYFTLPSSLSSNSWTFGAIAPPTGLSNQVGSGNLEIYDTATGDALTINGAGGIGGTAVVYNPGVGSSIIQYAGGGGSTTYTYDTSNHLTQITAIEADTHSQLFGGKDVADVSADTSTGIVSAELTAPDGVQLAALSMNGTTDTGTVTITDAGTNLVIPLTAIPAQATMIDPPDTPENILLGYLADLGTSMTAQQLDQLHYNNLHPTGSAYNVNSAITVASQDQNGNKDALVIYDLNVGGNPNITPAGLTPGAVIDAPATASVTLYATAGDGTGLAPGTPYSANLPAYNVLYANGDISQDTISGINELDVIGSDPLGNTIPATITLTADQFNSIGTISDSGTLIAATGGTFDLTTKGANAAFNLIASDWSGTTLIGSDYTHTLTASLFGNDKLVASNSANVFLVAGDGVDTLIGGTGGDNFVVGFQPFGGMVSAAGIPAANSVIEGQGTGNTLYADGDISGDTISGIQTLAVGTVSLTPLQLNSFSVIGGGIINATVGGAYSLEGKTGGGAVSLNAISNDGTTLIGDDNGDDILTASISGDDTLVAGIGTRTTLEASGTLGDNMLDASKSTGGETLDVSNSGGNNNLIAGSGTGYDLNASGSYGDNTLDASRSGGADTLDVTNSDGNNTLIASAGGGDVLNATGAFGDNTFVAGPGTSTMTGGEGNNTYEFPTSTFGNTVIVNNDTGFNQSIIEFGTGITSSNVTLSQSGNDLQLALAGGNTITVQGYFTSPNNEIDGIQFGDGTVWDQAAIEAHIPLVVSGAASLTADQFAQIGIIEGSGTIFGTTGGTYDLSSKTALPFNLTAQSNDGTTLTGNNAGGEALTASTSGNDTLNAGNGAGDVLNAGGGLDILNGGNGGDTFNVGTFGTPMAGSQFHGGTGSNTLVANGDLTGYSITGIETLQTSSVTLTGDQFNEFSSFASNSGFPSITITTGGTFSLAGKLAAGISGYMLATTSADPTTLIADDTNGAGLNAAQSTGNVTLIAGNGAGDLLLAGSGTDVLTAGNGGDTLVGGSGTTTMTGGTGNDFFVAGSGSATMQGNGGNDTYAFTALGAAATYTINNYHTDSGQSVIQFEPNFNPITGQTSGGIVEADVTFSRSSNDLVLTVGNEPITVQNYFLGDNYKISGVNFADGTSLTSVQIDAMVAPPTPGQQESIAVFGEIVSPSTLANVANVLGTGATFDGSGNTSHLAALNTTSQLTVSEFDGSGNVTFAAVLKNADGTAYVAPSGTSLVETAQDLLGDNGYDVVTQTSGGASTIAEFSAAGLALATQVGTSSSVANGGSLSVTGTNELVIGSDATISLGAGSTGGILQGASDTVSVGNNSSLSVYGASNALTLGSGDTLNLDSGTSETVNSTDNTITAASGVSATVNGGGNTVTAADGDTITIEGNNQFGWSDVVHLSNGAIDLASNASMEFVGSGNTITGSDHAHVGVDSGNDNTITVGNNGNVYIEASTGNTANITGGTVSADTGVSATIIGGGNTITGANGDTIAVGGNGETGWADSLTMSSGNVNVAANTSVEVAGANNTIAGAGTDQIGIDSGDHNNVTAGTGSDVWVNSGNDTSITTSGSEIDLAANITNTSIVGSNNTINGSNGDTFDVKGSDITINVSHATVYLDANTTNVTLNGSDDVVHILSGDTGTINGSNDPVTTDTVLSETNGATVNHFNGSDQELDFTGLAYDTSITVTESLNGNHTSGTLTVQDNGTTVETLTLTNITTIGSFNVRSDGNGGTLLVDPPDGGSGGHQDQFVFRDAGNELTGWHSHGQSVPFAAISNGEQFHFHADQLTQPANPPTFEFIADHRPSSEPPAHDYGHSTEIGNLPEAGHDPLQPHWSPHQHIAADGFHLV